MGVEWVRNFVHAEKTYKCEYKQYIAILFVIFPMFEKVHVKGEEATPLYRELANSTSVSPGWNFHKYLIRRDGTVVANFASKVKPDDPALVAAIERELKAPRPGK